MSDTPTNIRAHQGDQVLELAWGDEQASRLRYHYLRGECPCATCRNEWTGERVLDPSTLRPDLKVEGLEPIGNYAVRIVWNDGHSSGLYSWDALKKLAEAQPETN